MGKSTKPRKAYKPKPVRLDTIPLAMAGSAWVESRFLEARRKVVTHCVEAACQGRATSSDWKVIFDCINTIDMLIRAGHAKGDILAAQEVMEEVLNRAIATGSHALKHQERVVIQDVGRVYMECIEQCTGQQLHEAETTVGRILREGLRSGKARVVDAEKMGVA